MSASDDTLVLRPEITAFVEAVRRHLADLDDETRDDLLGGLEADLADQLAEGTGTPLGDPAAYAAELRSAAGLPEARPARRLGLDTSGWPRNPDEALDRARAWFLDRIDHPRLRPGWDVAVALRPAWWVARAWIAVTMLDVALGPYEQISVVPTLGFPFLGAIALVAAIAISTLIGLGRLWPGSGPDRAPVARLVLLAANVLAVLAPVTSGLPGNAVVAHPGDIENYQAYDAGWNDALRQSGVMAGGRPVTDIFAYDAAGKPIDQVQLVDQDGRPLGIRLRDAVRYPDTARRTVACPAYNGDSPVTNAFPFARLQLTHGRCTPERAADATKPTPPLASLPPITPAWPAPPAPAAE